MSKEPWNLDGFSCLVVLRRWYGSLVSPRQPNDWLTSSVSAREPRSDSQWGVFVHRLHELISASEGPDTRNWIGVKQTQYAGMSSFTVDLILLRRNRADLRDGLTGQGLSIQRSNNADRLVAFHRWNKGGAGSAALAEG